MTVLSSIFYNTPKFYLRKSCKRIYSQNLNKFGSHALHALSIEFEPYKNSGKKIKLEAPK